MNDDSYKNENNYEEWEKGVERRVGRGKKRRARRLAVFPETKNVTHP